MLPVEPVSMCNNVQDLGNNTGWNFLESPEATLLGQYECLLHAGTLWSSQGLRQHMGVYSGEGVSYNEEINVYVFDPSAAEGSFSTITYSIDVLYLRVASLP